MSDKGSEPDESLSATGMFLRAMQSPPPPDPTQAPTQDETGAPVHLQQPAETLLSSPVQAVSPFQPAAAEPGEFTRMFRAVPAPEQPRATAPPLQSTLPSSSAQSIAPLPPQDQSFPAASIAGGEFTSAFVAQASPVTSPGSPVPARPAPPKSKGFSTPGLSDSVSPEGSFTQIFRPVSPMPLPPEPSYPTPAAPATSSSTNSAWTPDPASSKAQAAPPAPSSFTAIFNALSSGGESSPPPHSSYKEPLPTASLRPHSFASSTPPAQNFPSHIAPPGGGVTQLINLLSEGPSAPVIAPIAAPTTLIPAGQQAPAPMEEEFFRITKQAQAAPPVPAGIPSPPAQELSPPPLQAAAMPKVPALPTLSAAAPALPAPLKSRLQEALPLLLVANAFLMLILIVLVVFMLHRR